MRIVQSVLAIISRIGILALVVFVVMIVTQESPYYQNVLMRIFLLLMSMGLGYLIQEMLFRYPIKEDIKNLREKPDYKYSWDDIETEKLDR